MIDPRNWEAYITRTPERTLGRVYSKPPHLIHSQFILSKTPLPSSLPNISSPKPHRHLPLTQRSTSKSIIKAAFSPMLLLAPLHVRVLKRDERTLATIHPSMSTHHLAKSHILCPTSPSYQNQTSITYLITPKTYLYVCPPFSNPADLSDQESQFPFQGKNFILHHRQVCLLR